MSKHKIEDLRDHLFSTIEKLQNGSIDIEKAKAISDIAQVIVNSAKVEVDFLKVTEGYGTGFIAYDSKNGITLPDGSKKPFQIGEKTGDKKK